MDNFSITIYGSPLHESLYTIDLENKTISTDSGFLVLDFRGSIGWTFETGRNCTFHTSYGCTFTTGAYCTFITSLHCIFNTGINCTFNTGGDCTFKTGRRCTFKTGKLCTFSLYDINSCKFKSYDDISTILDINDNKHYILTKELIRLLKVTNG